MNRPLEEFEKTIKSFKATASEARLTIRPENLENYDIECDDHFMALKRQPEDARSLYISLKQCIQAYLNQDLSTVPPMVLMRENESPDEWMSRRYEAGGYYRGES